MKKIQSGEYMSMRIGEMVVWWRLIYRKALQNDEKVEGGDRKMFFEFTMGIQKYSDITGGKIG